VFRSLSALALLLLIVVVRSGCVLASALLIYRRSKGIEVWSVSMRKPETRSLRSARST